MMLNVTVKKGFHVTPRWNGRSLQFDDTAAAVQWAEHAFKPGCKVTFTDEAGIITFTRIVRSEERPHARKFKRRKHTRSAI